MKQKIIELINKIYEEQDEDKAHNLLNEFYLLNKGNSKKCIKVFMELDENAYFKQIEKIGKLVYNNPKWDKIRMKIIKNKNETKNENNKIEK